MLFNLIKISLYFLRKQTVELCDRKNWEKSVFISMGYISMIIVMLCKCCRSVGIFINYTHSIASESLIPDTKV